MEYVLLQFIDMPYLSITIDNVLKVEQEFYDTLQTYWRTHNYLSLRWWFLVALTLLPPLVWWKFVDKKRVIEITSFGLFYGVAATFLDSIGSNAMVWTYIVRLSPYINPQMYPYNVGIVIIPFMLVYQKWGYNLKSFFISAGFLSAFTAFIGEPLMEWLLIYKEITWKNIYSFPIYWLLGIIVWCIITYFKKLEQEELKR
ncbi:CBO0543 family protein [Virgibacillus sp. DJP39]|uniref:CBO0543 family protein n=1 Tax=Virgibacillus sp. DJP39 TaxID=3409790 RepID=UPI003BB6971D